MSLNERITEDLKNALKAGDKDKLSILRMIKSSIKYQEIEKKAPLGDDDISAILRTYVKRAKESIEQYSGAGRADLADKEEKELAIVQSYLPDQLDENELRQIIRETISETGASGLKDMGKVMKAVMARAKGQADGKMANILVKEALEEE